MRFLIAICTLSVATVCACAAGEVRIFVETNQITNAICVITNSTEHEVFVLPVWMPQEFYATPACSDCATNWISHRPGAIGKVDDLIPLAPKAALKFPVDVYFQRPWRITTCAFTKRFHFNDREPSPPMDPKDRIELRTHTMQPSLRR